MKKSHKEMEGLLIQQITHYFRVNSAHAAMFMEENTLKMTLQCTTNTACRMRELGFEFQFVLLFGKRCG